MEHKSFMLLLLVAIGLSSCSTDDTELVPEGNGDVVINTRATLSEKDMYMQQFAKILSFLLILSSVCLFSSCHDDEYETPNLRHTEWICTLPVGEAFEDGCKQELIQFGSEPIVSFCNVQRNDVHGTHTYRWVGPNLVIDDSVEVGIDNYRLIYKGHTYERVLNTQDKTVNTKILFQNKNK